MTPAVTALMNWLRGINWRCLVSPAPSQALGRAAYCILHLLGCTCGSRDFCNSFHSTGIVSDVIHALRLWGRKKYLGSVQAWRVMKNISSFCSWRAEERQQKKCD